MIKAIQIVGLISSLISCGFWIARVSAFNLCLCSGCADPTRSRPLFNGSRFLLSLPSSRQEPPPPKR